METPLPEFHPPGDPLPGLLGPTDSQRLGKNNVGKDKGSLGVPGPSGNPSPLLSQYFREAAPYCARGSGISASQLRGYTAPTTLPDSVVRDSPIQVQPIVVMRVVSIDSLQQQVRTFRCEVW